MKISNGQLLNFLLLLPTKKLPSSGSYKGYSTNARYLYIKDTIVNSNLDAPIDDYAGRYIEPFFGGGSLFFYLEPERAIINDINTKLIQFYLGVRDDYPHLHEELARLEDMYNRNRKRFEERKADAPDERVLDENEELYYRLRDMYNGLTRPAYSEATLYYYINKTAAHYIK